MERRSRRRDLRHPETAAPGTADDLGADLHEFLPEAGRRPVLDRLRQRQRAHDVGEIVLGMKLKPSGIGREVAANFRKGLSP